MSFSKIPYSTTQLEKQLLNTVVGNHDLCCGCEDPLLHITNLIFKHAKPKNFTEKEKLQIKLCLGDTDTTDHTATDAVDGLTPGDLEKLFEQEDDEEG